MKDDVSGGSLEGPLVFPKGIKKTVFDNKYVFYTKTEIEMALKDIPIEKYVAEVHDCDDFAKDGVNHVQHKLPGAAIGIAIGHAKDGGPHAVVVFWAKVGNRVQRYYYDTTGRYPLTYFDIDEIII
jgi:hypothetical protein